MNKNKFLAIASLMALAAVSYAPNLWLQAPDAAGGAGYVNQEFAQFPDFSTYLVGDVTVGGPGWIISDVSVWMTDGQNSWAAAVTEARLHIFEKTGSLPDNVLDNVGPTFGLLDDATFTAGTGKLTMSGLSLFLAPGDYWVGLTALVDFTQFGQEFQLAALGVGVNSAGRNPGEGFAVGPDWFDAGQTFAGVDWDGSLEIHGEVVPEPASMIALGLGIAALVARRRRKKAA